LYGLRSAIVLSAADRDGLTLLNIFKKFPLPTLKIDSVKGWQLMENVSDLVKTTSQAVNTIQSQADREIATAGSSDFTKVPDLRQPGIFGYFKESFELKDLKRDRVFPVDLYLPDTQETTPLPLVIISHGLGGDRLTFAYLASHLASYGFAVAVPEHPGSNGERLMSLLNGLAKEVSSPQELIDRPQDITYLLNYLQVNYSKKINVEGVGIIGQSFGAYTALAVSGAQLNFALLKENCQSSKSGLNLSLLIQCLGNKLSEGKENWRDERISATIAINPLTSSIFGREQLSKLQLPLMILTGSADTVTPAYIEQIQPFTWLTNPEKYLVLLEHATHFSTLAKSKDKESIPIPERAIGPDPEIAQTYLKALSVTFMQTYIAKQNDYRIYLNAAYAKNLSQKIMPLSLIRSLEKDKL
jgi:predicted dienelactone hydrolase